jgi:hypothetical protein
MVARRAELKPGIERPVRKAGKWSQPKGEAGNYGLGAGSGCFVTL